ncbi:MAG: hypothetical protein ACON3Z_04075 [Bradymonadia bacterium]
MYRNFAFLMGFVLASVMGLSKPAEASDGVELKVAIVHALKSAGQIDAKISKKMAKSLRTAFGQYKSFKLISKTSNRLGNDKRSEILLPTGDKAVVTYLGKKVGKKSKPVHKLALAIPKHKVKVNLSAVKKKLFYQAGIKHNGGILILAFYLK